jgi:hypothetical protein
MQDSPFRSISLNSKSCSFVVVAGNSIRHWCLRPVTQEHRDDALPVHAALQQLVRPTCAPTSPPARVLRCAQLCCLKLHTWRENERRAAGIIKHLHSAVISCQYLALLVLKPISSNRRRKMPKACIHEGTSRPNEDISLSSRVRIPFTTHTHPCSVDHSQKLACLQVDHSIRPGVSSYL